MTIDSADKIGYLHAMKKVSNMKNGLLRSDKVAVEDSLKGWDLKNSTSSKISSNNISQLIDEGYSLGATAAKVSGLEAVDTMFMTSSEKAISLKKGLLLKNPLTHFCKFTMAYKHGGHKMKKKRMYFLNL